MSMRKGVIGMVTIVIFSMVALASVFGFLDKYQNIQKRTFQEETTNIIADRIAGDIYAISSYPREGSLQLDLKSELYTVEVDEMESPGDYEVHRVNVSYDGRNPSFSNVSTEYGLETGSLSDKRYICIEKAGSGRISVQGGQC